MSRLARQAGKSGARPLASGPNHFLKHSAASAEATRWHALMQARARVLMDPSADSARRLQDLDAREDMCMAALFGGLALANAGLGAVHGFAGPIGGMFDAPHGAVCAALPGSSTMMSGVMPLAWIERPEGVK